MKGVVFTEFTDMVETKFGLVISDEMIEKSTLPTGGAYTTVGTYNHQDLLKMVENLSIITKISKKDLTIAFGTFLFGRFYNIYPYFFSDVKCSFDFLDRIESYIHPEVLKLYPDAQLPKFETRHLSEKQFELIYSSPRPFGDLAEGLILGCADIFKEKISLSREDLPASELNKVRFLLTKE